MASPPHLFEQEAVAAEHGQRGASVVTGHVELLSTADLHRKQVALHSTHPTHHPSVRAVVEVCFWAVCAYQITAV